VCAVRLRNTQKDLCGLNSVVQRFEFSIGFGDLSLAILQFSVLELWERRE
jgi:hypothetical protein